MIMRGEHRSGGFSLVELLVVMAIIAILMGISIPILRMFSQNDMDRGARSLYTLVRAARVYATTYNVKAAVVYELDQDPVNSAVRDTLRGQSTRVLRGAMLLYQLPDNMGSYKQLYVPTVENGGEFTGFPFGYSVLLDAPPTGTQIPPPLAQALAYGDAEIQSQSSNAGLLGMTWVQFYDAPIDQDPVVREAEYNAGNRVWLLGHVFDSGGRLYFPTVPEPPDTPMPPAAPPGQRFSILFAPSPDRPAEERTWATRIVDDALLADWWGGRLPNAQGDSMGMVGTPIEIYRSTGRVRMGSL